MELHPTPESWRVALVTAVGALIIAGVAVALPIAFPGSVTWAVVGALSALAAIATLLPALGTLSATVDADTRGVTTRRFGHTTTYSWTDIVDVRVVERRASVPDGTEYHWVIPHRSAHVVAVPCLDLANGQVRELVALAAPATGPKSPAAREHVELLGRLRSLSLGERGRADRPAVHSSEAAS